MKLYVECRRMLCFGRYGFMIAVTFDGQEGERSSMGLARLLRPWGKSYYG